MTRLTSLLLGLLLLTSLITPALSQRRRDPLNNDEVDQLRETAQEPQKRMKLLIKFARTRMELVEQLRANPALAGEDGFSVSRALEDVAALVDEVDSNLDMYNGHSEDLRKSLKAVVEMDSDFQIKLRALKESSSQQQLRTYGFALDSAIDSVNESSDSARVMLNDQLAKRGKPKEGKDKDDDDPKPHKNHKD